MDPQSPLPPLVGLDLVHELPVVENNRTTFNVFARAVRWVGVCVCDRLAGVWWFGWLVVGRLTLIPVVF